MTTIKNEIKMRLNKNFNFVKKSKKSYNELFNADDKLSKLREIFGNRFPISEKAANEYGFGNNYVKGANIAAFRKIAKATRSQGII